PAVWESAAAEYILILRLFAGMKPWSKILDIGCGSGQVAIPLRTFLDEAGRYEGWDLMEDAIAWCIRNISKQDPRFRFMHLDVQNGMYNPRGRCAPEAFTFPADGKYDVIFLKSVFSHMLPPETRNYLRQISLCLGEGGKCLATFFVLNGQRRDHVKKGGSSFSFKHHHKGAFIDNEAVPEATVGYAEEDLMEMIRQADLRLSMPPQYGSWDGNRNGLSFQDILILERVS
ncbi:MAG TPA: class I SAM-dependent methyltransferase, partial [Bacteroidota bacterium]|nr:class I SAM-dependent methyltransferase [Bacteroidota bacterium]